MCELVPLGDRFVHEPEAELFEVAQTTVNQLGASGACPAGKIAFLNQDRPETARRCILRNPRPGDPSADYEQIRRLDLFTLAHVHSQSPEVCQREPVACALFSGPSVLARARWRTPMRLIYADKDLGQPFGRNQIRASSATRKVVETARRAVSTAHRFLRKSLPASQESIGHWHEMPRPGVTGSVCRGSGFRQGREPP